MNKKDKGYYGKFNVVRMDGQSAEGKKHEYCSYFVLDLDHDPFALPAIEEYIKACRKEYPQLALELTNLMKDIHNGYFNYRKT